MWTVWTIWSTCTVAGMCVVVALLCSTSTAEGGVILNAEDHALVTLVTGADGGYANGAMALGSSYLSSNGNMSLVVMVTAEVPADQLKLLSKMWQVIHVDPVACNHKLGSKVSAATHDLNGENYKAGIARWKHTCTKFRTWELTQFKRVVFMDSDMLVVNPIDHALYSYSNASFAAAPETFPPDTFNAGFMVITPSHTMFEKLLEINKRVGSAEGGDQGVLNNGLCPHWFFADNDDPYCGRLPWIFNVEAVHYKQYETLQNMASKPLPAVIHFVSDGKPWVVLAMDYIDKPTTALSDMKAKLIPLTYTHALWRLHFFRSTGYTPPLHSLFGNDMDSLFHPELSIQHSAEDTSGDIEDVELAEPAAKNLKHSVHVNCGKPNYRGGKADTVQSGKYVGKGTRPKGGKVLRKVKKNKKFTRHSTTQDDEL